LGKAGKLKYLWQSPFTLHKQLLRAVQNETQIALAGRKARIILKMNALLEPEIIGSLYEASKAGVEIDLIIRGVCALRPGIPEISSNIRVRSIVGRFLEHSRVFYFRNDGSQDVYLASADWMDRNFFRRVEVCFPVLDPALKKRVIGEGLNLYLEDNAQAWEMDQHGQYQCKSSRRSKPAIAQNMLIELLARRQAA
jgi:polyphosphate kinase